MVKGFRKARDRRGEYEVDWSIVEEARGDDLPSRIEFIPFSQGDARVPSMPADEAMYCGIGHGSSVTHAVIELCIGDRAVHIAMSPARLRHFAECLIQTADLIEQQRGVQK